jgi:hypothetical protein
MGWLANLHLRLSKQALGLARVSNPPRCIRMSQGTSFPVNNDDDDDDHNDNGNNYGAKGQRDNGRRTDPVPTSPGTAGLRTTSIRRYVDTSVVPPNSS